ncbi:hypothetical protein F5Y06DRAFT_275192 [Hypoxylon sp. FL0890]|nr:hypothetical protein F5Y06DRAFT_275192 [Hypoxylon sp. FL0890]
MYGIIAFNKGEKSPSAEFSAELGRYGRGSACKECRISRVRCSGTLDGKICNRCKRLSKRCLYTNSQGQRHHRNNQSLDINHKSVTSTRAASPDQATSDNHSSDTSSSSQLDLANCDEAQVMTDDPLEIDFGGWLQLESTPSVTESLRPHIDLVATPPRTELPDPLCLPPLQPELSQDDGGTYETSELRFTGLGDSGTGKDPMANHELATSKSFPDLQGWISDARGSACQCKCLQAMTSSLSFLRNWTWGRSSGPDSGVKADGAGFNCVKVEDFLSLFEKSMVQLQTVENCPMACILSQDLAILLLLIVEQLTKLLLSLAADSIGRTDEPSLDISARPPPWPLGNQAAASTSSQQGQDIRLARIGTFEIMDPLDLQMIMRLLLQIRTQALNAYIYRWSNKIKSYGFKNLEADLLKIREDLSRAVFLENIRESSSILQSSQSIHSVHRSIP